MRSTEDLRGLIPWSTSGFREMEPRIERVIGLRGDLHEMAMALFAERYGELSPRTIASYWRRFFVITDFVAEHRDDLLSRELLQDPPASPYISDELLDVLTTLPYALRIPGSVEAWEFDPGQVLREVARSREMRTRKED